MPRKSELQSEEVVAASPVRRSNRKAAAPTSTLATDNATKTVKSRRSSQEIQDNNTEKTESKPFKGKRSVSNESNEEEKKPVRGRRLSATEELKPETPRATRSRRSSTNEKVVEETKAKVEEVVEETKKVTRRRRSLSIDVEDSEIKEKKPLTRARRLSTDKQEEILQSPAAKKPRTRRGSLDKSEDLEPKTPKPAKTRRRASISLDPIVEQSVSPNSDTSPKSVKVPVKQLTPIKKAPITNSPSLDLSVIEEDSLLEEDVEDKLERKKSSRRSTEKSAESKNVENKIKMNVTSENVESLDVQSPLSSRKSSRLSGGKISMSPSDNKSIKKIEVKETESKPAAVSDLKDSMMNISTDETEQSQQSQANPSLSPSSDKENIPEIASFPNIAKKSLASLTEVDPKPIRDLNVSLARVSNVFRPKGIEYSFVEPMDVDEPSMIDSTQNKERIDLDDTNLENNEQKDNNLDESVDESFRLCLEVTNLEEGTGSKSKILEDSVVDNLLEPEHSGKQKLISEEQKKLLTDRIKMETFVTVDSCKVNASPEYEFNVQSDDEDNHDEQAKTEENNPETVTNDENNISIVIKSDNNSSNLNDKEVVISVSQIEKQNSNSNSSDQELNISKSQIEKQVSTAQGEQNLVNSDPKITQTEGSEADNIINKVITESPKYQEKSLNSKEQSEEIIVTSIEVSKTENKKTEDDLDKSETSNEIICVEASPSNSDQNCENKTINEKTVEPEITSSNTVMNSRELSKEDIQLNLEDRSMEVSIFEDKEIDKTNTSDIFNCSDSSPADIKDENKIAVEDSEKQSIIEDAEETKLSVTEDCLEVSMRKDKEMDVTNYSESVNLLYSIDSSAINEDKMPLDNLENQSNVENTEEIKPSVTEASQTECMEVSSSEDKEMVGTNSSDSINLLSCSCINSSVADVKDEYQIAVDDIEKQSHVENTEEIKLSVIEDIPSKSKAEEEQSYLTEGAMETGIDNVKISDDSVDNNEPNNEEVKDCEVLSSDQKEINETDEVIPEAIVSPKVQEMGEAPEPSHPKDVTLESSPTSQNIDVESTESSATNEAEILDQNAENKSPQENIIEIKDIGNENKEISKESIDSLKDETKVERIEEKEEKELLELKGFSQVDKLEQNTETGQNNLTYLQASPEKNKVELEKPVDNKKSKSKERSQLVKNDEIDETHNMELSTELSEIINFAELKKASSSKTIPREKDIETEENHSVSPLKLEQKTAIDETLQEKSEKAVLDETTENCELEIPQMVIENENDKTNNASLHKGDEELDIATEEKTRQDDEVIKISESMKWSNIETKIKILREDTVKTRSTEESMEHEEPDLIIEKSQLNNSNVCDSNEECIEKSQSEKGETELEKHIDNGKVKRSKFKKRPKLVIEDDLVTYVEEKAQPDYEINGISKKTVSNIERSSKTLEDIVKASQTKSKQEILTEEFDTISTSHLSEGLQEEKELQISEQKNTAYKTNSEKCPQPNNSVVSEANMEYNENLQSEKNDAELEQSVDNKPGNAKRLKYKKRQQVVIEEDLRSHLEEKPRQDETNKISKSKKRRSNMENNGQTLTEDTVKSIETENSKTSDVLYDTLEDEVFVSPVKKNRIKKKRSLESTLDSTTPEENKLDKFLHEKLAQFANSSSEDSDMDEYETNEFVDDMAMEGEEDTPSEDSNQIIDEGESIHSSESDVETDDDYDDNDSFICNEEDDELLSGEEYDLSNDKRKKSKKSRIINIEDNDSDIIVIEPKERPISIRKKSRIVAPSSSSSDENEENKELSNEVQEVSFAAEEEGTHEDIIELEKKTTTRKSSITIHENVRVDGLKDSALTERINLIVGSFCNKINKGDISMNLSLEYEGDVNREGSPKQTSGKQRSGSQEEASLTKRRKVSNSQENVASEKPNLKRRISKSMENVSAITNKRKKKSQHKINSRLYSYPESYSLFNGLITDIKNRPKRSVKPSTSKMERNCSWVVEVDEAKPSTSIVSKKEKEDFQQKKVHAKDFRQQMLYNSSRVRREDSKTMLRKRGAYY